MARLLAAGGAGQAQVEHFSRARNDLDDNLRRNLGSCLETTSIPGLERRQGKARDMYTSNGRVVAVATDRISAFDRGICTIPYKGQCLNECSAWWHRQAETILPSALESVPDPNACIMKECDVIPVEFVGGAFAQCAVRGYCAGSTKTSLWTAYSQGRREFCGNALPDGLSKNDELPRPIVTPTTKDEGGDEPTSGEEVVRRGIMTQEEWEFAERAALELFRLGQRIALGNGLLLADTKYELGRDRDGSLVLVDEIHTPDSSRWWLADSYASRKEQGLEPESLDKDLIRSHIASLGDPYSDTSIEVPDDLRVELARRYIHLFECITGERFSPADPGDRGPASRVADNVLAAL